MSRIDDKRPLPVDVLLDARQDRRGPTSGPLINATPVKTTAPVKLTAAQADLLRQCAMADDRGVYTSPNYKPMLKLVSFGFVEPSSGRFRDRIYITPAGRAWLAARDGR